MPDNAIPNRAAGGSDASSNRAANVLTAIRQYENRCLDRVKAKSLLRYGHTGASIPSESPTEAGRIEAIEAVLRRG